MVKLTGLVSTLGMVIVTLVACSTDGDELSFEAWQSQISEVCNEYEPKLDKVEERHGQPTDFAALEVMLVEGFTISEDYVDASIDIGVPSERGDEVEGLYADLKSGEALADELLAAVRAEDVAKSESIAAALEAASEDLNAQAAALGVPACDSRGQ